MRWVWRTAVVVLVVGPAVDLMTPAALLVLAVLLAVPTVVMMAPDVPAQGRGERS